MGLRRWFRRDGSSSSARARRVLLVNQYYWPDHASTAQHLSDLAESLAARGHECHVLCARGRYQPGGPRPPGFEIHEKVHIHRVPATSFGRGGTWSRMADYLSFYAGALARAFWLPRCDVVVTLTTPPIIGLLGTLLRWFKGSRHIYWSMDLHPDASLALGRMSPSNWGTRALGWLSAFAYRQADRVVALGPYMAERIARKGVAPERIRTVPVWSRREEIYPVPRGTNAMRKSLGLGDAFVVMYSGNLGLAHSFEEILGAAKRLRDRADVVFLFIGGGPRSGEVRAAMERDGLTNVRLLDYVPRSRLHVSLSLADVHLISMRPEMTGIVAPGKLYGVMAAGRPAIFIGPERCETADTIANAGCGIVVAPGDADGVYQAIARLADGPNLARRMGERGRTAFLAGHERALCCNLWRELIDELVGPSAASAASAPALARVPTGRAAARHTFLLNRHG